MQNDIQIYFPKSVRFINFDSKWQIPNTRQSKLTKKHSKLAYTTIILLYSKKRENVASHNDANIQSYLFSSCMRAVVPWGITKIECRFGNYECLFRKFNFSSDWFGSFECHFANFQRPSLCFSLNIK